MKMHSHSCPPVNRLSTNALQYLSVTLSIVVQEQYACVDLHPGRLVTFCPFVRINAKHLDHPVMPMLV